MLFDRVRSRPLLCASLFLVVAIELLVLWRYSPPSPKPATAPEREFSAERAFTVLGHLLAEQTPHPTGSEANRVVRQRIIRHLTELGYEPSVQVGKACGRFGRCAEVYNVVAHRPGKRDSSVLLLAHYDSVPYGPGVADDGSGVAALLEIARILKASPPDEHSITFLFGDGEELGLLGAELFMRRHPLAPSVRAAVNLEARGTSGPSLLFETSRSSAALVELYAKAVERPVTSSLFDLVYRTFPNDTDLSVLREHGVPALNLAFIEGARYYHTPEDNLRRLSLRSLQHQGENALAMTESLSSTKLDALSSAEAVYFDVLATFVVRWPRAWTLTLSWLVALGGLLATVAVGVRERLSLRTALFALLAFPLLLAGAAFVGFALGEMLRATSVISETWTGEPRPSVLLLIFTGVVVSASGALWLCRRFESGALALWVATYAWWLVMTLVVAALAPEASFLFLMPALAVGVSLFARLLCKRPLFGFVVVFPAGVVLLLWLPVLTMLYAAIGFTAPLVFTLLGALLTLPLAPALER